MYIGISWNNHHHLLHTVRRINGRVMWANLHLWLSRLPLLTGWVGESRFAPVPMTLYVAVTLMAALA